MKESLENRGSLNQIKARIRAEVFNVLDDRTEARPALSNENVLINELIREYLEFNKYKYTASVLQAGECAMWILVEPLGCDSQAYTIFHRLVITGPNKGFSYVTEEISYIFSKNCKQ